MSNTLHDNKLRVSYRIICWGGGEEVIVVECVSVAAHASTCVPPGGGGGGGGSGDMPPRISASDAILDKISNNIILMTHTK